MTRAAALKELDAATYQRHALHAPDRIWLEKNCYIDIWIELVHALNLDPMAMMPFTVSIDFEGDQWTFFKPPHEHLRELYGIDVQEMYVWRPLLEHALEHLAAGKFISTEADAFWLPDTAGTDYRAQHTKTTVVLNRVDVEAKLLGYFHNAGYHELTGEDFDRTFRVGVAPDPTFMPLFAELVRADRIERPSPQALRTASRALLRAQLNRLPVDNPIRAFQSRFNQDLPLLTQQGLASYHLWAFGTLRQLGAASELSALYLRWLSEGATDGAGLQRAAEDYLQISNVCKTFILKGARAVNAKRALDSGPVFDELAAAWERATATLRVE